MAQEVSRDEARSVMAEGHGVNASYVHAIDGLRGVAVAAVVLFHVDESLVPGGFTGVDVFFVISGYLIAGTILRAQQEGSFRLLPFLVRRIKRLLPAAAAVAFAVAGAAYWVVLPRDYRLLGIAICSQMSLVANVLYYFKGGDYFAQEASALLPLLHTWSLALEEQFYLLYALVFGWLGISWARGRRLVVLIVLMAISFGISLVLVCLSSRAAYYLLPGRLWELLGGAMLAFWSHRQMTQRSVQCLGLLGAACVVVPMWVLSSRTPFPGFAAVPSVVGTCALLLATSNGLSIWNRILEHRILVGLGAMSYSLYLWHWPILVLARYHWCAAPETAPPAVSWIAAGLSLPISFVSYRFIEQPFRYAALPLSQVVLRGLAVSAAGFLVGAAIFFSQGLPSRLPESALRYARGANDWNPERRNTLQRSTDSIHRYGLPSIGADAGDGSGDRPRFLIWGDSHADSLVPMLHRVAAGRGIAGLAACRVGTAPLPEFRMVNDQFPIDLAFTACVYEAIKKNPVTDVILAARWSGYLASSVRLGDLPGAPGDSQEGKRCLSVALEKTVVGLRHAGVARVWVVQEAPTQPYDVPRQLAISSWARQSPPAWLTLEQYSRDTAAISLMLEKCKQHGAGIISLGEGLLRRRMPLLSDSGSPMYCDRHHLSVEGAMQMAAEFTDVFSAIAGGQP
jgi:peptidoglycan/LPS O-acetylase OafA/YrhL